MFFFAIGLAVCRTLLFGFISAPGVHAQATASGAAANGHSPSFEVASIRPVSASRAGYTSISPYGSSLFIAKNISLSLLINLAYNVDARYIQERPKDMDAILFDIDARAEGNLPLNYKRLQPLLQTLLRRRFHLSVHWQTKDTSGYALIVSRKGPKLRPTKLPPAEAFILPDEILIASGSIAILAATLSHIVHRPVVDKTQIEGNYDITLKYAPYAPEDASDSTHPFIFTALKEQLGLELKPQKVPVQLLVIDHVNTMPSAN